MNSRVVNLVSLAKEKLVIVASSVKHSAKLINNEAYFVRRTNFEPVFYSVLIGMGNGA